MLGIIIITREISPNSLINSCEHLLIDAQQSFELHSIFAINIYSSFHNSCHPGGPWNMYIQKAICVSQERTHDKNSDYITMKIKIYRRKERANIRYTE